MLAELKRLYPKAFIADPEAVMPLALYIHHKIPIPPGFDRKALSKAFKLYTATPEYLAALAAGKPRVNLDGEPVGFVSEAHQREAADELANPGTRKPKKELRKMRAVALAASIETPDETRNNPMPKIEFAAVQAKITLAIDTATFRAALNIDTVGAKTVPVTIAVDGRKYTAQLNPKSFRKAQSAFKEAANPMVAISGNLNGDAVESAGIQVFDKGAKGGGDG